MANDLLEVETHYWSMRLTTAAEEAIDTTMFYAANAIHGLVHEGFISDAERDRAIAQLDRALAARRGRKPSRKVASRLRMALLIVAALALGGTAAWFISGHLGFLLSVSCLALGVDQCFVASS